MKNRIVAFVIAITMIGASSASAFDLWGGAQKGSTQKGATQKGAKRSCSLFGHRGCGKGSAQKAKNGSAQKGKGGSAQKGKGGWKRNRGCGCGK